MIEKGNIISRLKNLERIRGVIVATSTKGERIDIINKNRKSLNFSFVWCDDHFIGHFVDMNGNLSQADVILRSGIDAGKFIIAYDLLLTIPMV